MLLDETARGLLASKYSSCPLKKRPVTFVGDDEMKTPEIMSHDMDDNEEPENLSLKPEDLMKTGKYPTKSISPAMPERSALRVRIPLVPSPQYICKPDPQYLCKPEIEAQTEIPLSWHTPVPQYPAYLSTLPYCPEPFGYTSPIYPEQFSPYAARPASCSPPLYSSHLSYPPSSPTSSRGSSYPSPPPVPEDLTSPGSVSSDSGVSACSDRKRKTESGPRYRCPDCDKSYSTYSGLTKHRQYHCAASEIGAAKKSFSCKYCAKVYTSLGALKMHIRTHTLPCKCHLCGKAFSRPWLLQGHIRTHTGEKPFSCHHCRRAFADRSNLRAHLQTHSEVKKYSCTTCSKTFSRMSLLSKHNEGGCGAPLPPHYPYRPEDIRAY